MTIDHSTCSEWLPAYLRGELAPEQNEQMGEHLAGCEECRLEERALRALGSPLEEDSLRELESARLHREVWAAVRPAPQAARRSLQARMAPYLGVAAALLLLAVGVTYGGLSGGGDDEGAATGSGAESLENIEGADGGGTNYDEDRTLEDSITNESLEATVEFGTDSAGGSAGPAPVFDGAGGSYDDGLLRATGEGGYPFTGYVTSYSPEDAARMQDGFLDQLAGQAGGAESAVRACGRSVLEGPLSEEAQVLPAWAALGSYADSPHTVIIGVAFGDERLDRYSFSVFRRDDCSNPVETIEGPIGT
ncbi:MAG: anti-sigma factor family protein [Actinomycetota bacterium]